MSDSLNLLYNWETQGALSCGHSLPRIGVHRSRYEYWKNRPQKPDGRRAVIRSQVF